MSHQPAAAVTVMVIDCWEVTAVLVGASNLNHKDRVAAAAHQHGKHWGTLPYDPQMAERALEKNCKLLTIGNEIVITRRGIDTVKSAFGGQFS